MEETLAKIVAAFGNVPGVCAVVLGGSRATDTANAHSDIDIGIYYRQPLDMEALKKAGAELDDRHRPDCMTEIGEWGPWINGGGWLQVDGTPVDILLRDLNAVERAIADCCAGKITIDYQCGHPFGFVNSIYMGEMLYCKILCENGGEVSACKAYLWPFPQEYKRAAIEKFLWESRFSLDSGRKCIARGDKIYAAGVLFRSAMSLVQALYAHNEMICLNEKGALARLSGAKMPGNFAEKLESAFGMEIAQAFAEMDALHSEVERFVR